jgi:hypothetical protein
MLTVIMYKMVELKETMNEAIIVCDKPKDNKHKATNINQESESNINTKSTKRIRNNDDDENDDDDVCHVKTKRVRFDHNVTTFILEQNHTNHIIHDDGNHEDEDEEYDESISPPLLQRTVASCWLYYPYSNRIPPSTSYYRNLPKAIENKISHCCRKKSITTTSSDQIQSTLPKNEVIRLNWLKITKLPPTSGSYLYHHQ